MSVLTVCNEPKEAHRALWVRATQRGRSTEAEVRQVLEQAVLPEGGVKLGGMLAEIRCELGGVDLGPLRDKTPAKPMGFE